MRRVFLIAALVMLWVPRVFADSVAPVILSGSSSWNNWTTPTGQFFSQQTSWDGEGCGVGNYIANEGQCGLANFYAGSPNAFLPYLGTGSSAFAFTGDSSVTARYLQGVTAHSDEFGWFSYGVVNPVYHPLFRSSDALGSVATFNPTGMFGLYIYDSVTGLRWQSNNMGDVMTHFALFQAPGSYVFGMDDLPGSGTDFDYNDMIVEVRSTPVPEPSTMTMVGLGLFAAVRAARKRKK